MKRLRIKNSIKSISNIDNFYLHLIQVIPKVSLKNEYYFILIFEDGIEYRTDALNKYNDKDFNKKLDIDINDYLTKRKNTISITGDIGNEYIIDDYTIQDLLYYVLDDKKLFYHNKFTNIYYTYEPLMFQKTNFYYSSLLFTKYFKLKEYIDDVFIFINKQKRQYNKKSL